MITVKRYNPDAAMSISREHAWMRETPEGGHVEYGDYASLFAQFESVKAERDALAVENAALKSGCGFFAYDPDNGFEEFKTKDEAIAAAESYIDYYRGEACDGWPDEVAQVSWGIIMQESTRVNERPRTEDDSCDPNIKTVCDYALLPNIETPATSAALAAVQAQGVEKFAKALRVKGDDAFFDAIAEAQANAADEFAANLREAK